MPTTKRKRLLRREISLSSKFERLVNWIKESHPDYVGDMSIHRVETDKARSNQVTRDEQRIRKLLSKKWVYSGNNPLFKLFNWAYGLISTAFTIFFSMVLVITVSYMPPTGEVFKPNDNEVSLRYIEKGLEETGAVNMVAGMILDYRAFDTLGESHVLFAAAIAVMVLLRVDRESRNKVRIAMPDLEDDSMYMPDHDAVLQKMALLLVPVIMMFGIYVVLNGHISPGGGFSGGAIIGAALMLYLNAYGFEKTEKFFNAKTYVRVSFCALAFYALAKCYAFFCGANGLDSHIPEGIPGHILSAGLILPLDIAVGCVVACTMYGFYALFRKGGF